MIPVANSQRTSGNAKAGATSRDEAPNWSLVGCDVRCGRCNNKLNDSTDPVCNDCGLGFDWPDVLPIHEMRCSNCDYGLFGLTRERCPECGESFNWDEVLVAAKSRRRGLFEYQWRQRGVRSLVWTWWLSAFRPVKLWNEHDINTPPRIFPLLAFAVLQWAVFVLGWPVISEAALWGMNELVLFLGRPNRYTYDFHHQDGFLRTILFTQIATFLAFQLLYETKRKIKIRWQQFLRVLVHATAFAALTPTIACLVEIGIDAAPLIVPKWGPIRLATYLTIRDVVLTIGIVTTWISLSIGFKRYLKLPQPWIVSSVFLLLGFLAARSFLVIIDPYVRHQLVRTFLS